jgi:hypothetical protein
MIQFRFFLWNVVTMNRDYFQTITFAEQRYNAYVFGILSNLKWSHKMAASQIPTLTVASDPTLLHLAEEKAAFQESAMSTVGHLVEALPQKSLGLVAKPVPDKLGAFQVVAGADKNKILADVLVTGGNIKIEFGQDSWKYRIKKTIAFKPVLPHRPWAERAYDQLNFAVGEAQRTGKVRSAAAATNG